MSRLERERWKQAEEQWPTLQRVISGHFAKVTFEPVQHLPKIYESYAQSAKLDELKAVATECAVFLKEFSDRYDDVHFMIDGFGALVPPHGKIYDSGDHAGIRRIKLLYDPVVATIRKSEQDWKP